MTAIPPRPQEAENPRPNLLKKSMTSNGMFDGCAKSTTLI